MSGDPIGTIKVVAGNQFCTTAGLTGRHAVQCSQFGPLEEWQWDGGTGLYPSFAFDCTRGLTEAPTCKKIAYAGNASSCCLEGRGQQLYLGDAAGGGFARATCDPKYLTNRERSDLCRQEFVNICSKDTNLQNNTNCKSWIAANANDPSAIKVASDYCSKSNGNMSSTFCKDWCYSNPGKCDAAMTRFCQDKPYGNDLCACINSPAKNIYNPACVDTYCRNTGYKLAGQNTVTNKCPDVVDCSIINNLTAASTGKIVFDKLVTEQKCGNAPIINPTAVPPQDFPSVDNGGSSGTMQAIKDAISERDLSTLSNQDKGIFGILVIIIVILFMAPFGIIAVSLSSKKAAPNNFQQQYTPPQYSQYQQIPFY